ncbi:MAG: tetratricopeptide repeat protein [Anaerolineales bacterium]|nr:tetratricopeptide repeat protein [Anaerolineales bacterium]
MATIPLRDYCREIENMIDQGHTDEAIGHCRHILKHFPKHLETYRLLGKAYLESKQLGDAADLFQRVLSSVPEDFVAHIGMSIIREDEGNLDASIWHMERAFEMQSSNVAIQDELKRLYTARDGQEPLKIRLTRGALAHMYAKGHLHTQAIAELRAALGTDPKRLDLQTLLAEMYHADKQSTNAAKIASQLMTKLPYNLVANLILADVLTKSQRANEAAAHQTRLQELDPYYKYVSTQYPVVDTVPSGMIVLEVLDWEATKGGLISQPAWATSIGVDISNAPANETLPEWFSPAPAEERNPNVSRNAFDDLSFDSVAAFASSLSERETEAGWDESQPDEDNPAHIPLETTLNEAPNMQEEDDNIPDWMKNAGWSQRDPNTPEEPSSSWLNEEEEEEPAEQGGIAKANIPDWLKAMAPSDMEESAEDSGLEADLPDWLQGFNTAETSPTRVPPAQSNAPSWLSSAEETSDESDEVDFPGFLEEKPSPAASSLEKADMPDWLKDLNPASDEAEKAEVPDWLGSFSTAEKEASEYDIDALEESTAPDWLQSFGDEVVSSTLPSAHKEEPTMPDWLSEDAQSPSEEEMEELFGKPSGETVPANLSWLDDLGKEEEDDPSLHSGVTDWLSDVSTTPEEAPAEPADEVPDWLRSMADDLPVGEELVEDAMPIFETEEVEPSFEMTDLGKEPEMDFGLEDDAMAWLEALAAKQGAKEEELLTNAASREETHLPSWLEEMTEEESGEFAEAELEEAPNEEMIPDWLKGMEEEVEPATLYIEDQESVLSSLDEEEPIAIEFPEMEIPAPEEPAAEEALPDMDNEDAAMAWLEALAAKQGAKEEELLTAPSDRSEDVPDWLKGILSEEEALTEEELSTVEADTAFASLFDEAPAHSEPVAEDAFAEDLLSSDGELDLEEPTFETPEIAEADNAMLDEDAALAWLESLAMKHGVNEAELLTDAEKRPEGTPDWVNAVAEEARAEEAAHTEMLEEPEELELFGTPNEPVEEIATELPAEAEDTWLSKMFSEEEDKAPLEAGDDVPDWLTDTAANWLSSVSVPPVEEESAEEPFAEETPAEEVELPDWLTTEEEPVAETAPDAPAWVLEESSAEPEPEPSTPEPPSWILEEETAEEEIEMPAWLMEDVETEESPSPEEVGTEEVEEIPEPEVEMVPEPIIELEPEPEPEPILESPIVVDGGEALNKARTTLARGEVATAADHYARLIKSNQNVDEAITDLTEALNTRYPVDIDLWLSLGDAYVKKNKLQDALDAYTKAEELLR